MDIKFGFEKLINMRKAMQDKDPKSVRPAYVTVVDWARQQVANSDDLLSDEALAQVIARPVPEEKTVADVVTDILSGCRT